MLNNLTSTSLWQPTATFICFAHSCKSKHFKFVMFFFLWKWKILVCRLAQDAWPGYVLSCELHEWPSSKITKLLNLSLLLSLSVVVRVCALHLGKDRQYKSMCMVQWTTLALLNHISRMKFQYVIFGTFSVLTLPHIPQEVGFMGCCLRTAGCERGGLGHCLNKCCCILVFRSTFKFGETRPFTEVANFFHA